MSDDQAQQPATVPHDRQVLPGIARTAVPIVAGEIVAIAAKHGFNIDSGTATDWAVKGLTVAAGVAYWIIARLMELRGRKAGSVMLGSGAAPLYQKKA